MKDIIIVIAGDLLPSGNNLPFFIGGDGNSLYGEEILNLFNNADFSIINLEGPLTDSDKQQWKVDPILKAPQRTINGIKSLGVSAVALANNHISDYLQQGYLDTIKALSKAEIDYVGAGDCCKSVKNYLTLNLNRRNICIYNVSETFFNSPDEHAAGVNLYDEWRVLNEIKDLKSKHDYLIVIYHGGAEEFPYPTPMIKKRFHRMADCGADFITAQHTHCVGCEEWYNGSYLLYGQGNFMFARMKNPITKRGLVSQIIIQENGEVSIKHHLVKVNAQDCLEYDGDQDFSDFVARSNELKDDNLIVTKYEEFAYNNNKIRYRNLKVCKGWTLGNLLLSRTLRNFHQKHYVEFYSANHLLRMMILHEGERYNEDFLACLRYMIKKYE